MTKKYQYDDDIDSVVDATLEEFNAMDIDRDYDIGSVDDTTLEASNAIDIQRDYHAWSKFREAFSKINISTFQPLLEGATINDVPSSIQTSDVEEKTGFLEPFEPEAPILSELEENDINHWNKRLSREQVFSKYYFPEVWEAKERNEIKESLGLEALTSSFPSMFMQAPKTEQNEVTKKVTDSIFSPGDHEVKSILLKKGPLLIPGKEKELFIFTHGLILADVEMNDLMCLLLAMQCKSEKTVSTKALRERFDFIDNDGSGSLDQTEICECFKGMGVPVSMPAICDIFTAIDVNSDGTITFDEFESMVYCMRPCMRSEDQQKKISTIGMFGEKLKTSFTGAKKAGTGKELRDTITNCAKIERKIDCALPMSMVERVESMHVFHTKETSVYANSSVANSSFAIFVKDQKEPLVFICSKPAHRQAWVDAFRTCIIQEVRNRTDEAAKTLGREVGWQHRLICASIFSLIVCNCVDVLQSKLKHCHPELIDKLDEYNSFSPLHYAAILDHSECLLILIQSGANVEIKDGEGRTPMYHAVMSDNQNMILTLVDYGAKKVGAEKFLLFRPELEELAEIERNAENDTEKTSLNANAANGAMSEAMSALRERGEKIEELDIKTSQLHRGATDYADMARKLKEKTKKNGKIFGW